jgi:hypothetical protein
MMHVENLQIARCIAEIEKTIVAPEFDQDFSMNVSLLEGAH